MTQSSQLGPGSVVGGDFTIVAPLDEGGMGAVFIAEQRSTGKRRALKLMHREIVADPGLTKRFEQEAKVGARIRSEHVVEVLAAGVDGPSGLPFLVMELLEGEDLRHRVKRGALAPDEVRVIFEQLSHAMGAAHASGVVHRDLKPENVFLATSLRAGSAPYVVKVLDFGIAKIQAEAGTRATRGAVGSPMWMAPEQTAPGPVTPAADVWAMGLLAYELFTGRSFWRAANEAEGTTAQLIREIVLDPIPAPSARATRADALPPGFDAWFARCVAREPLARFSDASHLWRAMQGLFGAPSLGPPQTVREAFEATADAVPYPEAPTLPPIPTLAGPRLPAATPLESAQDVARVAPSPRPSRWPLVAAAVVAAGGIGAGLWIARARPAAPISVVVATASAEPVVAPAPSPSIAPEPPVVASVAPPIVAPPVKSVAPPIVAAAASSAPAAKKVGGGGGGFTDPVDKGSAVTWKVQDRHVRLFTRLVTNDSNVIDATVRKAIEWSSWEYLRCYERAFANSKDMPEGVVTVGYDILDQLPRHAALVSSSIESKTFNDCVVGTLVGQTINAAGPDGKGHAVHAFRFVPN